MVRDYLERLLPALGGAKPSLADAELEALHRSGDYAAMVRTIRDTMKLDLRLRIGLVNSGGSENTPAWVSMPKDMPMYGTKDFKKTLVTVYLRKSFLEGSTAAEVTMAIAHELSHIVLNGIGHPLRHEEEAVDLTAMALGFSTAYFAVHFGRSGLSLGYLSGDEVRYAAELLSGRPSYSYSSRADPPSGSSEPPKSRITVKTVAVGAAVLIGMALVYLVSRGSSPQPLESIPQIGSDRVLSHTEIAYCLAQEIRLDAARRIVDPYDTFGVERFNSLIAEYNSRCGRFRYPAGELESTRSEVESRRPTLETEGQRLLSTMY